MQYQSQTPDLAESSISAMIDTTKSGLICLHIQSYLIYPHLISIPVLFEVLSHKFFTKYHLVIIT